MMHGKVYPLFILYGTLEQAINVTGFPHEIVIDKSGADYAGHENINILLMLA